MSSHKYLEDAFAEHNITDVSVGIVRFEICDEYDNCEDASFWRAFLNRDHILSAERCWCGEGDTMEESIWNAIHNKGPITNSRLSW